LAALHQEIAALPEGAAILAEDESHINLRGLLQRRLTTVDLGPGARMTTHGHGIGKLTVTSLPRAFA